jgi:hypothetical protein
MNWRQRLCRHTWTSGLTLMDEDVDYCARCHLPYDAWHAHKADPIVRGVRWFAGGAAFFLLIATVLGWDSQPGYVLAYLVGGSCGCFIVAARL